MHTGGRLHADVRVVQVLPGTCGGICPIPGPLSTRACGSECLGGRPIRALASGAPEFGGARTSSAHRRCAVRVPSGGCRAGTSVLTCIGSRLGWSDGAHCYDLGGTMLSFARKNDFIGNHRDARPIYDIQHISSGHTTTAGRWFGAPHFLHETHGTPLMTLCVRTLRGLCTTPPKMIIADLDTKAYSMCSPNLERPDLPCSANIQSYFASQQETPIRTRIMQES